MDQGSFFLKLSATGVDDFAKATLETKDRLDGLATSALALTGAWGRLYAVSQLIPGVGTLVSGALKAITFVAVGTTAAVAGLAVYSIRLAGSLSDLSNRSQVARRDIQALQYAAAATSAPFEKLLSVFEALAQAQGEVRAGIGRTDQRLKAAEELGISEKDLRTKDSDQLISDLLERNKDGIFTSREMAAGVYLMGDAFRDLAAAAKKGMGGALKEFNEANRGIKDGTINTLDGLKDAWEGFWATVGVKGKTAVSEVAAFTANTFKIVWASTFGLLHMAMSARPEEARESRDSMLDNVVQHNLKGFAEKKASGETSIKKMSDDRDEMVDRNKKAAFEARIRSAMGDDAEDVLDDLKSGAATVSEYERAARRAERESKKKKKEKESNSSLGAQSDDPMTRIGLFIGAPSSFSLATQRQQARLDAIHRTIEVSVREGQIREVPRKVDSVIQLLQAILANSKAEP